MKRRLPHAALLVLGALVAGVVIYLTWPSRVTVLCEQLPQLAALAACAATLLVVSIRALARMRTARAAGIRDDARVAGGAAILAALAFFLAAHYVAQYRKPCSAVQQRFFPGGAQHGPGKAP